MGDPEAQKLADWLVSKAGELGIQSVIYDRRVWGYGRWSWLGFVYLCNVRFFSHSNLQETLFRR